MAKFFKGFRQVSAVKFNEAKKANLLEGYLWFVRTEVSDGATNDVSNDDYDIYFGSRHYGHFRENELPSIKESINNIKGDVNDVVALLDKLTTVVESNSDAITTLNEKVKNLEEISHDAYIEADKEVLNAAIDEVNKLAQGVVAENKAAIAILNGDENTEGSVIKTVTDEIAKVIAEAPEALDTLKEIADYIASDKVGAAELSNRISALESIDHEAYKEYTDKTFVKLENFNEFSGEMEEKLEAIEKGAQINKIESIDVNGVKATVTDKHASVSVSAKDIEIGEDIIDNEEVIYDSNSKVSSVLQSIQNSITKAEAGGYKGVVAGNGINAEPSSTHTQHTISIKVSDEANNLISVNERGIFAAMYYDGDDMEPIDDVNNVIKNRIENGGSVVLEDNVNLMNSIVLSGVNSVVDLNDSTIQAGVFTENNGAITNGSDDSYVFWVKNGSNLIINGNGVVKSQPAKYSMAVWAQGGTVTINGGTYKNAGEGSDLIYASNGGKVYIYGGEFKACEMKDGVSGTNQAYSTLNIKDSDRGISEIIVYGGKFYGFDPANNTSEGDRTNFVAPGYKSVEVETGVWEVMPK